jgi:hypothetical protein
MCRLNEEAIGKDVRSIKQPQYKKGHEIDRCCHPEACSQLTKLSNVKNSLIGSFLYVIQ